MRIRFDQGPTGAGSGFAEPETVIRADTPGEVPAALDALAAAQTAGRWLAGVCSYELGFALDPALAATMPADRAMPLLSFGVYEAPRAMALPAPGGAVTEFAPRWQERQYRAAFARVHDGIARGNLYQANLTFPIDVAFEGSAAQIYAALARVQPVTYGALVEMDGLALLSRSPELFFRTDPSGLIETLPMKGTIARGQTPAEDAARRAWLETDIKNRAENSMIVDLLRNDISRIAEPGSVKVPELCKVEAYATVHQMVSRVVGRLKPDVRLPGILRALFPCGSITGAPKIAAMQLLADVEPWQRGAYCGAIGWAAPDGRSQFNVAIRTLTMRGTRGVLNVGGGVVWDSTADAEYEEALWKARFARRLMPDFA
ncbi:aminodeoxychorismate synthase component I [Pacificoceanicola onchidii]|uniref:aminodeoxychorismate synthase component I n=1 Tax=Pacificoceanicola onchidii TaxID=2562685 RepID=UPI0010A4B120|nr:aminodeoxychorismate synthase component I [Pacificoceanicola onchidii]